MSRVRASERERDKTIRVLRDGCAEGRLSASTLEQRVERALAAGSVDELRQLTLDVKRVSRLKVSLSQLVTLRRPAAPPEEACLWLEGIGPRPFVVGRSREADLVVCDESVSRRHAHIVRTTDGFMLADLGSTNGTWLSGRRVGQVEVSAGDLIELGELPLRLL
jgi:hypothetical protein